jgi:hypothetical protein
MKYVVAHLVREVEVDVREVIAKGVHEPRQAHTLPHRVNVGDAEEVAHLCEFGDLGWDLGCRACGQSGLIWDVPGPY